MACCAGGLVSSDRLCLPSYSFDSELPLWLPIDPFFDAVKRRRPSVARPLVGKRARARACEAPPNPEHAHARARCLPCLDYSGQSETLSPRRYSSSLTVNRVRVFAHGELEVRSVSRGSSSKPPPRAYGVRWSESVSAHGRRVIRRSVAALVAREACQVGLYTLSSRPLMDDREFNKRVHSFLAWGRKYVPHVFKHYVLVFELQARGTLHAHLLLFKRIPKGLWRRMRDLWAVRYDMGAGSFDVKKVRYASRAAAYLSKYLTDKKPAYRVGVDAGGVLTYERWRVGRNGEMYKRMRFRGNAYRVSDALRALAAPIAEYHLPWGSPLALKLSCNLRGGVRFFASSREALAFISANLPAAP